MQLYDLEQLHLLRDPGTGTKALVAWGKQDLIISFRGTANIQNATHDAKVSPPGSILSLQFSCVNSHCVKSLGPSGSGQG